MAEEKKMLTLEEHNKKILRNQHRKKAGVLCDGCKNELFVQYESIRMGGSTGEQEVQYLHCANCDYYRGRTGAMLLK